MEITRPSGSSRIILVVLAAALATVAGCTTSLQQIACNAAGGANCCPGGTLCVASGSLYVTASNQILHFSIAPGTGVLTAQGSVTTANPVAGVVAPFGGNFVYAVDATQGAILGFAANGTILTPVPGSPYTGFDGQARASSDGENLYMPGSAGTGLAVLAIAGDGSLTVLNPVPGIPQSTLPFASAVTSLGLRFVYISDFSAVPGAITAVLVDANTGVQTGVPASPFLLPAGVGPAGPITLVQNKFVYVSVPAAGSVAGFSIEPLSGALTPVPGSPFATGKSPGGLAADPFGLFLYVANQMDGTVSGFAIAANGSLNSVPGSPFPAGQGAADVIVSNSGHVYVANSIAGTISAFSFSVPSGSLAEIAGSPFPAGTRPNSIVYSPIL